MEKANLPPCERKNFKGKWAKTVGTDEFDKNLTKSGHEKKKRGVFVRKSFLNWQFEKYRSKKQYLHGGEVRDMIFSN